MEAVPGRRERKKLTTRHELRSAALRLVAERGLDRVTVQDIADEADVSTRTFFNHFASKEDAIVGADPGRVERLQSALDSRPADEPPLAALEAVLTQMAAVLIERQDERMLQMQLARDNPRLMPRQFAAFAEFERALVDDVARRTGTDPERDAYPRLAAGAAVAVLRASLALWRSGESPVSLAELIASSFAELAAGLPVPVAAGVGGGFEPRARQSRGDRATKRVRKDAT